MWGGQEKSAGLGNELEMGRREKTTVTPSLEEQNEWTVVALVGPRS